MENKNYLDPTSNQTPHALFLTKVVTTCNQTTNKNNRGNIKILNCAVSYKGFDSSDWRENVLSDTEKHNLSFTKQSGQDSGLQSKAIRNTLWRKLCKTCYTLHQSITYMVHKTKWRLTHNLASWRPKQINQHYTMSNEFASKQKTV